jgi:sterol desaturase/sphingolipid hydroxylase (fatty acid hydroxylase superfamily)
MEIFIEYFKAIPSSTRTIFLISGLTFFLLLEKGIPLFNFDYKKGKHALLNLTLTLMTLIINFVGATFILKATLYNSMEKIGLIHLNFNGQVLPFWLMVICAFIFLDFGGAWFIHWLEHKVKWMWKFHIIHHTDQQVDVTTGLRHHPGESIFRLGFTIIAVLLSGASIGMVMFYQTISAFFAHFSHANYKTPEKLDKLLSWIFVTPRFHRIHHHYTLPHTDSNFGNIFSIWDHIFRTNINVGEHEELKFGLDTHMEPKEIENIKGLLLIPFQKYRHPVGSKFTK